ncbi:MAG: nucleotide sugar dehydrogenase, partial [Acidimicrobiales bacterium]|nr:nucleotide sugar dehydrogenase [Acidimicrobiales bacterium]
MNSKRVVVVGQGYVGLPLAMLAIEKGHQVVGYDVDKVRVEALARGESFVEDISDQEVADALASGRYQATTDSDLLSGFDVIVITVPTPLRETLPDLSYVEAATRTLAQHLRPGATV